MTIALCARIRSDRRMYVPVVAFLVAILVALGYLGYRAVMDRFAVPTVLGANFSTEYRKIPYNTKSIDVTFSTSLDATSVTKQSVTLSPGVEGSVTLIHGNTVSYVLSAPLTVGDSYTLTLSSSIRSRYGNALSEDTIFTFEAIEGARATKILPSGRLQNLGQNIVVLFNVPVVAMTNLDERDKLPCPLSITPKIDGKCKWTNGNVLEFVPNKPLDLAAKYHLHVADTAGLFYPLVSPLDAEIMTPDLTVSFSTGGFLPRDGISVVTNAPVDPRLLERSLDLMEGDLKLEEVITPIQDEHKKDSETRFILTAKNHPFLYATTYSLTTHKGLKPKYGTEPLIDDVTSSFQSSTFLTSITPYRNIRDASGTLVDTKSYDGIPSVPTE